MHRDVGTCLCKMYAGFGTYSVLSLCEAQELKENKRGAKHAIQAAAHKENILSDVAATSVEPSNPPRPP